MLELFNLATNRRFLRAANMLSEIICLLFLLMLFLAVMIKRERARTLQCIALIYLGEIAKLVLALFAQFNWNKTMSLPLIQVDYVLSYTANMLVSCSFHWYFLAHLEEHGRSVGKWTRKWVVPYGAISIVFFFLLVWIGKLYTINEDGTVTLSRIYFLLMLLTAPIHIYDLFLVISHSRMIPLAEFLILLSYNVLPMLASVFDLKYTTVTYHVTIALISCMLYIYIDLKLENELFRKQKELSDSQLNLMVQQINPHFIFNTLGTIDSLCRTRPDEAQRLIADFSDYLWDNYSSLTQRPLIPFDEELQHLEHYLSIERVRFPRLRTEFDIRCRDFMIPSLTVQPLVENAVKHGICKRRRSEGTVRVSSLEQETAYVITVRDDGVGYDGAAVTNDGKPHVGLANVRKRLDVLCSGTLDVESTPGVGTVCTITLPKDGSLSLSPNET